MKPKFQAADIVLANINGKSRIILIKKFFLNFGMVYADLLHPNEEEDPKAHCKPEDIIEKIYIPSIMIYTKIPTKLLIYRLLQGKPVAIFELLSETEGHKKYIVNFEDDCWEHDNDSDAMRDYVLIRNGQLPPMKQNNSWLIVKE